MKKASRGPESLGNPVPPQVRAALRLLLEEWKRALSSGGDVSEFAVKATDLRAAGLSTNELRSLVTMGFVQPPVAKTKPGGKRRVWSNHRKRLQHASNSFVLTEAGARVAGALEPEALLAAQPPVYDRERRELWLGDRLVKRFTQPAPDQDTILSAFQELGWPTRIDDPLPPTRGQDPKLRLREAVKRLNRYQRHRLIRFRTDGRGKGILWEWAGRP